jgi:hypothetical protein
MARRASSGLVVLAVLASGCAELLPASARDVGDGQVSLRPLLDSDAVAIPGIDPAEVAAALGEPTSSEVRETTDDEPAGTVTTMQYDGLEIVVHEVEEPRRAFITDLVISTRTYVPSVPVTVGAARSDVERLLGEPSATEGRDVVYDLTDDGDRCIVTYDGDRAQQIAFQFG